MSVLTVQYEALLKQHLNRILAEAIEQGATLPLFFAIVSANGSFICGERWTDRNGQHTGYVSEREGEIPGLIAPVNVMVCDTSGQANRWVLEEFKALQ